jgi:hypothetical protein
VAFGQSSCWPVRRGSLEVSLEALTTVRFTNQPPGSGASVPDARISARFAWWFEVKTERGAVRRSQLIENFANLTDERAVERLFLVTPDPVEPDAVAELADPRLVWFSFRRLDDALQRVLDDPPDVAGDQARFLLSGQRPARGGRQLSPSPLVAGAAVSPP